MFSAIILIHELGHFLLAKINGISVTEILAQTGATLKDPGSSSSAVSSPTIAQEPPRGSSFTE